MLVFLILCLIVTVSSEAVAVNTLTDNLKILQFKPFSCVFCMGFWIGLINILGIVYACDISNTYSLLFSLKVANVIGLPFVMASASAKLESYIYG